MNIAKHHGSGLLTASGTLDIMTTNSLREALLEGLSANRQVILDLEGIERCDTAGLQVLLAAETDAMTSGKSLLLQAVSAPIAEVAGALGFSINSQAAAAVEAAPGGE